MNDTIIDNINAVVEPDDTLYHLGDFAFGDKSQIPALRERIACRNIILLKGNHDHKLWKSYRDCFSQTREYVEFRHNGTLITMFHYPIGAWNENGRGAIQLHGHSHGNYAPVGRQKDVGVDPNDFKPLLLDDVVAELKNVQPVAVDHHTKATNYH